MSAVKASESAQASLREARLPGLAPAHRGKVRDTFDLGERLLMVATDRLSAFDVIMAEPIPDRGRVLTQLAAWWFERTRDIVPNHFLSLEAEDCPAVFRDTVRGWQGRAMLVRRARPIPVECIVRGYLAGSAWEEYKQSGSVAGISLPSGLQPGAELKQPLFTPSTKETQGHDRPLDFAGVVELVGEPLAEKLRDLSVQLYEFGRQEARRAGLVLVDTKFEFGHLDGGVVVIDEMLTPDSSRYWEAEGRRGGEMPPGLDKQIVRDYLVSTGWDRNPPPPPLPDEVIQRTRDAYLTVFARLTGGPLRSFSAEEVAEAAGPQPEPDGVPTPAALAEEPAAAQEAAPEPEMAAEPAAALAVEQQPVAAPEPAVAEVETVAAAPAPRAPVEPPAPAPAPSLLSFSAQIAISLKAGVADPPGQAVESALHQLGFTSSNGVRLGKLIELKLEAEDQAAAEAQVEAMCRQLLANPVIENYSYAVRQR